MIAAEDPACLAAIKAYRFQVAPRAALQRASELGYAYPDTGDEIERTVLQCFLFALARVTGFERMWACVNQCTRGLLHLPWLRYVEATRAPDFGVEPCVLFGVKACLSCLSINVICVIWLVVHDTLRAQIHASWCHIV